MNTQTLPLGNLEHSRPAIAPERRAGDRTASAANFRDHFCESRGCPPEQFADRVFWLSLHFRAVPLVGLLWPWRKRLFAADYAIIEKLGRAQWRGDVHWKLNQLVARKQPAGSSWYARLPCCSHRRLGKLMMRVMNTATETPTQAQARQNAY